MGCGIKKSVPGFVVGGKNQVKCSKERFREKRKSIIKEQAQRMLGKSADR